MKNKKNKKILKGKEAKAFVLYALIKEFLDLYENKEIEITEEAVIIKPKKKSDKNER